MKQNRSFKKTLKQSIVVLMSLAMIGTTAGSVFASEDVVAEAETNVVEVTEDATEETSEEATEEVAESTEHVHNYVYEGVATGHYQVCSECGDQTETEAHTFGDWTVTTEATYTTTGVQERTCSVCGYGETEVIPKIAHTHTASKLTITDTTHSWTCGLCGEVYNEGEHDFSVWEYVNESVTDGTYKLMRSTCKCRETQTKSVPVETTITGVDVTITEPVIGEHPDVNPVVTTTPATNDIKLSYVTWFKFDPETDKCLAVIDEDDVFEAGYYYRVWVQYNTYQTNTVFDGNNASDMTFTFNGREPSNRPYDTWERITFNETFDTLEEHVHSYECEVGATCHYLVCTGCDDVIEENHTFDDDNVCTVCGYKEHEHTFERTTVSPTETETGYILDECTGCTYSEWYEIPVRTDKDITSVDVTITEPVLGEAASEEIGSVTTTPEGALDGCVSMWWTKIAAEDYTGSASDPQENMEEGETFTTGYYYIANIAGVLSGSEYEIPVDIEGTINGVAHNDTYGYACQTWTRLYLCAVYEPLHEHTFGDWTVTTEATYKTTGVQERTCSICGYTETEVIPKIVHTHTAQNLTITETTHSYTCKLCGEVYNEGEHEFTEWEYVNESVTDGTDKLMQRTCKCGKKQTKSVPVETTITSADMIIAEPVIGEHPDMNPTVTTTPATEDVKLAYIYWYKYDPATGKYVSMLKADDVFEAGYSYKATVQFNTYQTNTIFNGQAGTAFFVNGKAVENTTYNTWERITYQVAFGTLEEHVHSYTYESTADGHYQVCSCGDKTETEEHTFGSWKSVGSGKQSHTCTVCGYTETQNTTTVIFNSIKNLFKNLFGFSSKTSSRTMNTTRSTRMR